MTGPNACSFQDCEYHQHPHITGIIERLRQAIRVVEFPPLAGHVGYAAMLV